MVDIDLYAQIADLKEIDYRNNISHPLTIIEILVAKGFISRQEFAELLKN